MKKSLSQYCEDNILYLPQALYSKSDVKPLLYDKESVIFYKDLKTELNNIEIHTCKACLVYIKSGHEVITTCYNEKIELFPDDIIFFPKGVNFHSDYTSKKGSPNAYVIFFGDDVITEFLSKKTKIEKSSPNEKNIHKILPNKVVKTFFSTLHDTYKEYKNSKEILNLKLLELLYLLDLNSKNNQLCISLSSIETGKAKRNIKRLMEKYAISDLNINDFATLSGRSTTSFNREFKKIYNTSPKQWLIEKRLSHAYELLVNKQWSVTDTANEIGYENISHFIESFRKKYKKTPHQIKHQSD
ncbi:MAG: AraC family transcriptional regulator [Gammaproteobacteria bacterium]|nr:AraC family transcriptional regulator [Gammaproteobacteria bacterium]